MSIDLKELSVHGQKSKKKKKESNPLDFLNKEISFSGNKLKDKQKEDFYSSMSMLLSSGIDMRSALKIIYQEQRKKKEKEIFNQLYEKLIGGDNLSVAMRNSEKFTAHECFSVGIGEETGRLKEVLHDLALFFANRIKQRRQLINTFTYPVIVIVTALLVVVFMMNFIVPMFVDIFSRFNGELPLLTQWVMNASEAFKENFWIGLLIIIGIIAFILSARKKLWFRKHVSQIAIKIPVVGTMLIKAYMARFCQTMSLLMGARIPLLRAIRLMGKMISFYPFEQALLHFEDEILHGKTLYDGMERFSFFDAKIRSLTKVGEEINQLDVIYENLSKQYSEELQHQVGILNGLLEPILIIFVGLLVAVILVAMYLPMFQMSNSFA
ncbi:type II secretion system F family protein [Marinifilum breve]|uniref:Type II secretion system F family protein n=1 Tax=Marinifilum breve TaxID=2184082 RepID=A0A2V3ZYT8_9BACT|nr:type II secretion system F family protein [Marinifilum breve]PXY01815.1 type II secretion system F family protein [Marinifilum breve]